MTAENLKIIEVIANTVVQVAYVLLFSYIARLASAYLHFRLSTTGRGVFERSDSIAASDRQQPEGD